MCEYRLVYMCMNFKLLETFNRAEQKISVTYNTHTRTQCGMVSFRGNAEIKTDKMCVTVCV